MQTLYRLAVDTCQVKTAHDGGKAGRVWRESAGTFEVSEWYKGAAKIAQVWGQHRDGEPLEWLRGVWIDGAQIAVADAPTPPDVPALGDAELGALVRKLVAAIKAL